MSLLLEKYNFLTVIHMDLNPDPNFDPKKQEYLHKLQQQMSQQQFQQTSTFHNQTGKPRFSKIFFIIPVLVFLISAAATGVGIYAAMNPMGVFNMMQSSGIINMDNVLPPELMNNSSLLDELSKTGKRAMAKIVNLEDTGITFNKNPVVKMTLEIEPGLETTINKTVSRISLPMVGQYVDILYDPNNPSRAVAVHEPDVKKMMNDSLPADMKDEVKKALPAGFMENLPADVKADLPPEVKELLPADTPL